MASCCLPYCGKGCADAICNFISGVVFCTLSPGFLAAKFDQLVAIYVGFGASFCSALFDSVHLCNVCLLDRTSYCCRKFLVFVLSIFIWDDCSFKGISLTCKS